MSSKKTNEQQDTVQELAVKLQMLPATQGIGINEDLLKAVRDLMGYLDEVRSCMSCNHCHTHLISKVSHCKLNPAVIFEVPGTGVCNHHEFVDSLEGAAV